MRSLINIAGVVINKDADGRYCLNDLHRAAGGENKHRPSLWVENQQTQELISELQAEAGIPALESTKGGAHSGTYVVKELVYAYAMWISAKFHLEVIRTFDAVVTGQIALPAKVMEAAKMFPSLFRVGRMLGCDKPASAISANQIIQAAVGVNLLSMMGHTHLVAEDQSALYFTPSELGKRIGVSGRKFNLLLAEAGFQMKRGEAWEVLDAGKDFARIYDTGKKHGSGVPIQQIKWATNVSSMLTINEESMDA